MVDLTNYVPVIRTAEDHKAAISKLSKLIVLDREEDAALMDTLAVVIEQYERQAFPIPDLPAIEAVKYGMAARDWTQAELARRAKINRGRISEILQGQRGMSISIIRTFHALLGIPFNILIDDGDSSNDDASKRSKTKSVRAS